MAIPKLHKNIKIRLLSVFLTFLFSSMIYPYMAIYFSRNFGSKRTGLFLLIEVFLQILIGFYGGYLADRISRKKIMIVGLFAQLVFNLVLTLANSPALHSVWITLLMFILIGASEGLVTPAANALIIDSSTNENRTFVFSIQYWISNVSLFLSSLIWSVFYEKHQFELFCGMTVCSTLTLFLTVFAISDLHSRNKLNKKFQIVKNIAQSYKVVLEDKAFIYLTIGSVFLWSMESHSVNFIAVRLASEFKTEVVPFFHFSNLEITGNKIIGFLNTENAILAVLFGYFISSWIRNKKKKSILFISILMYFSGYVILSFTNTLSTIFLLGMIITFGEMFAYPILQTYEAEMMNETFRGSYSGFSSFGNNLTQLVGALGLTIYGWIGNYVMATIIVICGIYSFMFFYFSLKIHEENVK